MNYTMVLKKVLEFMNEQNNTTAKELTIESIEYELELDAPYLRRIRFGTCARVFQVILQRLMKGIYMNMEEVSKKG